MLSEKTFLNEKNNHNPPPTFCKLNGRSRTIEPFRKLLLLYEEFEDTKGVIIIRRSKKNRQHNGQKKKVQKDKQRSTKHTYKTKDRVTQTPLKTINYCI